MKQNESKHRLKRGEFRLEEFTNPSGQRAFRVYGWKVNGEGFDARVRENFKTHAEAVARKQELETEVANIDTAGQTVFTRLTPEQVRDAELAFDQIIEHGEQSLSKVARFFVDNYREPVKQKKVSEAFDDFIAEKTAANLRPLSLKNLKAKASDLLKLHGQKNASGITVETVRALIFKGERGPKARDNYRRNLHGFFAWAHKQGYCAENPVAKITPIKADRQDPAILTVDEAAKLLEAAQAHSRGLLVPYVALGLFAGLRPTELARLTWDRIDLTDRTITIGADIAKMRQKRTVEMSDNLIAWLSPFATKHPAIVGGNWRRDFDAVKKLAGWRGDNRKPEPSPGKRKFSAETLRRRELAAAEKAKAVAALKPWPQDVMRHTAISYHLAEHHHEGKTAQWAGNSPDMIQRHYKGLVKPADAKMFWQIAPVRSKKVVSIQSLSRKASRSKAQPVAASA